VCVVALGAACACRSQAGVALGAALVCVCGVCAGRAPASVWVALASGYPPRYPRGVYPHRPEEDRLVMRPPVVYGFRS
jgi:hypothetical protein